jgi:hypothetical protein
MGAERGQSRPKAGAKMRVLDFISKLSAHKIGGFGATMPHECCTVAFFGLHLWRSTNIDITQL